MTARSSHGSNDVTDVIKEAFTGLADALRAPRSHAGTGATHTS